MKGKKIITKESTSPKGYGFISWTAAQIIVWLFGCFIILCLFLKPALGIMLLWNILIPAAPALLVIHTGIWRNICPLAATALLAGHLGMSRAKKLSHSQVGKLNFTSVMVLYVIVPLRHAFFNNNGPATAILLILTSCIAVIMGWMYEWKSAWCSGLCPVHPVEKLYGENVPITIPNSHCRECLNCVIPCPDSTPNIHPQAARKNKWQRWSGILITGGLPGFVWGWFQVPDLTGFSSAGRLPGVYIMPMAGMTATLALYYILYTGLVRKEQLRKLSAFFAAAAVSCYYWYRIPALFGIGKFRGDGVLINLSGYLPSGSLLIITIATTLFFFYWLVWRKPQNTSWLKRPQFAVKSSPGHRK